MRQWRGSAGGRPSRRPGTERHRRGRPAASPRQSPDTRIPGALARSRAAWTAYRRRRSDSGSRPRCSGKPRLPISRSFVGRGATSTPRRRSTRTSSPPELGCRLALERLPDQALVALAPRDGAERRRARPLIATAHSTAASVPDLDPPPWSLASCAWSRSTRQCRPSTNRHQAYGERWPPSSERVPHRHLGREVPEIALHHVNRDARVDQARGTGVPKASGHREIHSAACPTVRLASQSVARNTPAVAGSCACGRRAASRPRGGRTRPARTRRTRSPSQQRRYVKSATHNRSAASAVNWRLTRSGRRGRPGPRWWFATASRAAWRPASPCWRISAATWSRPTSTPSRWRALWTRRYPYAR